MTTDEVQVKKAALEMLAKLIGVPVEFREFCHDWVLITYDLPGSKEGDRARREFLEHAKRVGAVAHSESVYLMPWTDSTNIAALELSKVQEGEVYLWYAHPGDEQQAVVLTRQYDEGIKPQIDKLRERALRILDHTADTKTGVARRMMESTWETFEGLTRAVVARGNYDLAEHLNTTRSLLQLIQDALDGNIDAIRQLGR